jgi:hypothetical protein
LAISNGIFIATSPPIIVFQISKLIFDTLLWVEVQKPTQKLKTVKGPGNTFDLYPKWERPLPSVGNLSWDIYRVHPKTNPLIPGCGLEMQKPTQALKSIRDRGNTFGLKPK